MGIDRLHIAIQGYRCSFHDEAARVYFKGQDLNLHFADSFDKLANAVLNREVDFAVMAIENTIAGTILSNYKLLRDHKLYILGEIYLPIKHQLIGQSEAELSDVSTVYSHPMALNQCKPFLSQLREVKLVEKSDTALSADFINQRANKWEACIASHAAASFYGLKILAADVQENPFNYTRFLVISSQANFDIDSNKASLYIQIDDQRGNLLKVLSVIDRHKINLSKLQSYPMLGSHRSYFFHLDLEFEDQTQYYSCKTELRTLKFVLQELGMYKRNDLNVINSNKYDPTSI